MFFFGPLSTHLPYILLGVVYLASVSFYSLKVMAGQGPEDNLHELTQSIDNSESDTDETLFVFNDLHQGYSDYVADESDDHHVITLLIAQLRGSPGHLMFSDFYDFNSFGRPPPQPLS